ncbi:DNA repair protein RecO [Thiofilum flexile]|uniref:DNA repair protein RecO n=1 Tax=Thiofilum flexile TaxID=125627 RepID=UPI0003615B50|nr:DNA repair protein RecO [Thiofilum flexile]
MSQDHQSLAFVLRRKPFRDQSLLLDLFTESHGKITCIAKYSKAQADRLRAIFEPLRLLEVRWRGCGEVFTLFDVDEVQRFPLKAAALIQGTYATEILLRGLELGQEQAELFQWYQALLIALNQQPNSSLLNQFELAFLEQHNQVLNLATDDLTGAALDPEQGYRFYPQHGIVPLSTVLKDKGVAISGQLLCALRQPDTLTPEQRHELRQVLDQMMYYHLNGKTLYARQLLQ